MTKRQRSPREKKALSYERDRRNTYGENSKSSRTSIALRKRLRSRSQRHLEKGALRSVSREPARASAGSAFKLAGKHRYWSKRPDEPLKKVVHGKLERRKRLETTAKKRARPTRRG
jgi:hypothetical protein